jgi:hypothetical protein
MERIELEEITMSEALMDAAILLALYALYKIVGRLFWGTKEQAHKENLDESRAEAERVAGLFWTLSQYYRDTIRTATVCLQDDEGSSKTLYYTSDHPDLVHIEKLEPGQSIRFFHDRSGVSSDPSSLVSEFLRLVR